MFFLSYIFWILFTGFFIAAYVINIPKGYDQELLILGLVYLYTTIYLFFCFAPTTVVTKPWNYVVNTISDFLCRRLSLRIRSFAWALIVVIVIVATVFSFPEKEESPRIRRLIALFGFFFLIFATWLTSAVILKKKLFKKNSDQPPSLCSIVVLLNGTRFLLPCLCNSF